MARGERGGGSKRHRKNADAEREAERQAAAEQAKQLESELFGAASREEAIRRFGFELNGAELDVRGHDVEGETAADEDDDVGALIWEDRGGKAGAPPLPVVSKAARVPVWSDEADEEAIFNVAGRNRLRKLRQTEEESIVSGPQYTQRLRMQHAKLNPGTSWAKLPEAGGRRAKRKSRGALSEGSDEEDGDGPTELDAVLQRANSFVAKTAPRLPAGQIEASRMKDANFQEASKAVVKTAQFHHNGQLLLTAGLDKSLRFFQVDGTRNPKVQGVYLEDTPIHCASFASAGSQVIASGRRKWFYLYDINHSKVERIFSTGRMERSLEKFAAAPDLDQVAFLGKDGYVALISLKSRQWVADLKMNGTARTVAFTPDGTGLLTSGGDGQIYQWDLRMQRCLHKTIDDGCINPTSLAVSSRATLVATGSDSGVVNVYNWPGGLGTAPKLVKPIMNLTTSVDSLVFSPDSQILACASRLKKDALRLVHLPSCTVFSNWPTSRTPLHCVTSLDFSPSGGFLAAGNARGQVLLYRLHHYSRA
eukprot:jgi/Chlat1/5110/Chrsp33S05116